jgi:UDP-glucuronate 4-epimerase
MRHVLVTGGAGFIGSHLVEALLAGGCKVTAVDNFDDYYPRATKIENLRQALADPCFRLVEGDIRDFPRLSLDLTDDYDCIVHLAAKTGVRPSINDPLSYMEVNVVGTQNMLDLARLRGVRQFVFSSSSSVYGTNPRVPWREEDTDLSPISPYAATKIAGELLGHVYSHVYGIRFLALRFFTVYGPRQRPDLAVHKFTQLLLDGQPIPVFGDGSTRRDYTFVMDVVAGLRRAIDYTGSHYEVLNIAGGRPVALRELIEALEAQLGVRAEILRLPEQVGDVSQTFAEVAKADRLLGFRCRTSIAEGLRQFAEWYRHRAGTVAR